MVSPFEGSEKNLDIKRASRRRRVFTLYMGGKSQAEIARELGVDRGTVRLDLDAVRAGYEEGYESVESVFRCALERVVQLRSELLEQARAAEGSLKVRLYAEAVKIDLKTLDRLMGPELMVSSEGDRGFHFGQFAMEWIAATYGLDGIHAFMEHVDSKYQSITSSPDYR
jgi:transposase